MNNSPAFNISRIHTPLQLEITSASEGYETLLWGWEMFSRLRHEAKPVEYYVSPDIKHGSHTLQNPRQLLVLQQRALDWWCYWLQDEESMDTGKRQQLSEWRILRQQHLADISQ
jgi:hypothetical protein